MIIIGFLLFSLLSVYMPHGSFETYEHHNQENLFKLRPKNYSLVTNLKKKLKKIRTFLFKFFRLPKITLNRVVSVNILIALLNLDFFKVSILDLFSFLCFYFHGSKYKHGTLICYH